MGGGPSEPLGVLSEKNDANSDSVMSSKGVPWLAYSRGNRRAIRSASHWLCEHIKRCTYSRGDRVIF
jgi:hypothetical protein